MPADGQTLALDDYHQARDELVDARNRLRPGEGVLQGMSRACAFTVLNRRLLVTDLSTGETRWHGSPLGLPVEEVQPLAEGGGAVVLSDYMARTNPGRIKPCLR